MLCVLTKSDIMEKNYQVRNMGFIYDLASGVFIWLGYQETLDQFFDIIEGYSHRVQELRGTHMFFGLSEEYPDSVQKPRDTYPDLLSSACRHHSWTIPQFHKAYSDFMKLEYWSRAWVRQEFSLAGKLLILTDSRIINFQMLEDAVSAL